MSAATAAPPVRRILAINMSHIGGVLLMTPALELLHQLCPEAEISALVRSGTEPVLEKHAGNFCEYFEFVHRTWAPKAAGHSRETAAREQLKKLLGD